MLKIQVLGKGLIPRGYGLAPRKEFFKADLNLIQTILMTPGLKVNMLNPEDGKIVAVTNANVKRLWERYRSDIPARKVVAGGITAPVNLSKPDNDLDLGSKLPEFTPNKGISNPTDLIKNKVNEVTPPATPVAPVKPVEEPKVENTVMPNVTTEKDPKPEEKVEDHKDETPAEKDSVDGSAETPAPAGIKPVLNNNNNNNHNKNHNNNNNQNKK